MTSTPAVLGNETADAAAWIDVVEIEGSVTTLVDWADLVVNLCQDPQNQGHVPAVLRPAPYGRVALPLLTDGAWGPADGKRLTQHPACGPGATQGVWLYANDHGDRLGLVVDCPVYDGEPAATMLLARQGRPVPWLTHNIFKYAMPNGVYELMTCREFDLVFDHMNHAHSLGLTRSWTAERVHEAVALYALDVTRSKDVDLLRDAKLDARDPAIWKSMKEVLGAQDLVTAEMMATWWHLVQHPSTIRTLWDLGFDPETLVQFRGTMFNLIGSPVFPRRRQDLRDVLNFESRRAEVGAVLSGEWTLQGRERLACTSPPGCRVMDWEGVWTQFMPARLANAYLAAGFTLGEAVPRHLAGEDPDAEALAVMAALQPSVDYA